MKHFTKLAFAILTVLTFSACSEDQTAFDIEKVPGRATVQGTVTYNEGATVSGGKLSYSYKPAADLKVFITVSNSSFDDNLAGTTVFETTTDANGKYSLEIPVPDYSVNISVRTAQFKGTHSTVEKVNNKVTNVSKNVVYGGRSSVELISSGYAYCDMVCTPTSYGENLPATFGETVTLKGRVGQNTIVYTPIELIEYYPGYQDARITKYFISAGGIDLIIKVNYNGESFALNATTNSQGEYSILIPVTEFPASFDYEIEALPKVGKFTQYYSYRKGINTEYNTFDVTDYMNVQLNGWYGQSNNINRNATASVANDLKIAPDLYMIFEPYADQETHDYSGYSFEGSNWLNN